MYNASKDFLSPIFASSISRKFSIALFGFSIFVSIIPCILLGKIVGISLGYQREGIEKSYLAVDKGSLEQYWAVL